MLISDFGRMNKTCSDAECIWQIIKYPHRNSYSALVTPKAGEYGAGVVQADYIDDLIEKIITEAERLKS